MTPSRCQTRPAPTGSFPTFRQVYRGVSASLGGSYAVGPHLVLRANVARGYRAPNIPEIGSNGLDPGAHIIYLGNPTFTPEFNWQEDVGVLWKSPGLEASAEAFYNHVENFIYQAKQFDANGQALRDQFGNSTYQFQQAAANLYGGELALNVHPTSLPWLSWRSGAALVIGVNEERQSCASEYGNDGRYLPLIPAPTARTELRLSTPAPIGRLGTPYLRFTVNATAAKTASTPWTGPKPPRPATCSAAWARALRCATAPAAKPCSWCCRPTTCSTWPTSPTSTASSTSSTTPPRPPAGWASTAPAAT